jgi:hypothetical protein
MPQATVSICGGKKAPTAKNAYLKSQKAQKCKVLFLLKRIFLH